jgi:hypothetical protein
MASQTREADNPERLPRLSDEAIRLYLQWLLGAELLGWEDEPDRPHAAGGRRRSLTAQDHMLRGVAGELREMTGEQAANLLEQVRLDIPDQRARFHFEEFAHNLRSATPDRSGTPTTGRPGLAEVQVRQEG